MDKTRQRLRGDGKWGSAVVRSLPRPLLLLLPPPSSPRPRLARAQPKTEFTGELIKRTGKVRMGIFDYPPYFLRDKASGEWVGAMVEMAKDIAKELDVKLEMVEVGGFAELVLSLQSNKVDMNFGLQATPKRATAIDFAGPIYWIEWVTVNNPSSTARCGPTTTRPTSRSRS